MQQENPNADVVFGTDIAGRNMEYMGYLGNYRDFGQAAAETQARHPARLHARCGAAGRAARHWPSNWPFRLRPNYAVPSGVYALLAALLFAASGALQAKTIDALSPSFFDVNKAIASAVDGDTVIIPAGTATWSSTLAITKAITLMGKTTVNSSDGTTNDLTVITRNFTNLLALITVNTSAGKKFRLSGFTFRDTSASNYFSQNGYVAINGNSHQARIDNCHFDFVTGPVQAQAVRIGDNVYGVADHNVFH